MNDFNHPTRDNYYMMRLTAAAAIRDVETGPIIFAEPEPPIVETEEEACERMRLTLFGIAGEPDIIEDEAETKPSVPTSE